MATKKIPTVEQLDELTKQLPFQDLIRHWKNLSVLLEDKKNELMETKKETEEKLSQLEGIE